MKDVPRFYFPEGKPVSPNVVQEALTTAEDEMRKHNGRISFSEFSDVSKAITGKSDFETNQFTGKLLN